MQLVWEWFMRPVFSRLLPMPFARGMAGHR